MRVKRLGLPHKTKVAISPDLFIILLAQIFQIERREGKNSKYFYILPIQKTEPVVLNRVFFLIPPLGAFGDPGNISIVIACLGEGVLLASSDQRSGNAA